MWWSRAQLSHFAAVASRVLERSPAPVRPSGPQQALPTQFLVEVVSPAGQVQIAETPLDDADGPRLSAAQLRNEGSPFTAPAAGTSTHSWRVLVEPLSDGQHAVIAFSLDDLNNTSDGVSATQGTVLHSLYGVGTDVTVTQSPTVGSGGGTRFNFVGGAGDQQSSGTSFSRDILAGGGMGTIKSSSVTTVSGLKDVSGATGALVLNDVKLSGTVSAAGGGQPGAQGGSAGSGTGSINSSSFTVTGVNPASDSLGPLSSGTITSGHNFTTAESDSNVAVVDSNYAPPVDQAGPAPGSGARLPPPPTPSPST